MKSIGKKLITGTIAASFLLGGAAVVHNQVYAADSASASAAQTQNGGQNGAKGMKDHAQRNKGEFRGGLNVVKQTATILGVDEAVVTDALKQGKTLAQFAADNGLTEDVYLQKLTAAETQAIDEAVSSGKLTQDQADQRKSKLADRLKQAIENADRHQFRGDGGPMGMGPRGNFEALTALGITKEDVAAGMKAGKSLAEIAQEKGISRDQLINKLKEDMLTKLNEMVDRKGATGGDAPTPKQGSATTATSSN